MNSEVFTDRLVQFAECVEIGAVARPRPPQGVDALLVPAPFVHCLRGLSAHQGRVVASPGAPAGAQPELLHVRHAASRLDPYQGLAIGDAGDGAGGAAGAAELGARLDGVCPAGDRVLSRALKVAMQRDKVGRNVCSLVDAPSVEREEVRPLSAQDARRVLEAA